ncbi:hypothetical protein C0992_010330 [Termitomyces sp. T32_za158]|nr:hypothetical protein C0992_010330 [Termitomyces sp. T32_za158]
MFAGRLAKWLTDERAYYPESRPQILRLLKVAQLTLRRNVNDNLDLKAPFHISSYVEHPMIAPYSTLLKAVNPHKDLFIEPDLHDEIKALLKTITAPAYPAPIALTSDPIESSPVTPSSSSPAIALQSPSLSSVHSTAHVSNHSQSPHVAIQTNANSTIVEDSRGASCYASDQIACDPCPGNAVKGDLSTSSVLPTTAVISSVEDSQALRSSSATPLVTCSPGTSGSAPHLSSTTPEVISKVKKKTKKKAGFGLESLIQTDIQDLQKRGLVGVNMKAEPTDVTISAPSHDPVSRCDQEAKVVTTDEAAEFSEIAPPPSSSYTVQSVKQTDVLETAVDGAMAVDHVLPHHGKRTTSLINGDSGIDAVVGQVSPQEYHTNYVDVDIMDGTSGTSLNRDRNLPSHKTSPVVHGWPLSQGFDENVISTTITTDSPSLKAAADLRRDMEAGLKWNFTVPDATNSQDHQSPENDIALRNLTSDSSFNPTQFHSATTDHDTGRIPLVTAHPMINDSYLCKTSESPPLALKNSSLQSLPNTLSSASSVVLPSEHSICPALQSSTILPVARASAAPAVVGNDDLLPVSTAGETNLAVRKLYSVVIDC